MPWLSSYCNNSIKTCACCISSLLCALAHCVPACVSGLLGTGTKDTFDSMVHQVDSSSLSSEAESTDDVWSISEEQRDYYFDQFKKIQPDVNGVILGECWHMRG